MNYYRGNSKSEMAFEEVLSRMYELTEFTWEDTPKVIPQMPPSQRKYTKGKGKRKNTPWARS